MTKIRTQTGFTLDSQIGFNTQRGSAYRSSIGFEADNSVADVQNRIRDYTIEEVPTRPRTVDAHYESRRGDAYKSSIGFGSKADSPPKRSNRRGQQENATVAPSIQDQGAAQIYQSRKGDAYKSSISFF